MATIKQKKVMEKVLKGSSISQAMREVGYSETTASTTGKLTNTKGWQELMAIYLPDEELAQVHKQGLYATKIHSSLTEPDRVEQDWPTRAKYLDMAYKVKGNYAPEKTPNQTVNIEQLRITIQQNLADFRTHTIGEGISTQSTETV